MTALKLKSSRHDLCSAAHAQALIGLLEMYAQDPMGGGAGLSPQVKSKLPAALAARTDALVLLAFSGERAVGLLSAFEGFSTFTCRALLNIHDIAVVPDLRRRGIGQALLHRAETIARHRGYCKLTLEVLEGNLAAQASYRACGFDGYQLDSAAGKALFWQKLL